ncbi:N-acetylneuraminate synthase [bacterium]|nr:N-acetylneuraminate synthase [bacterium]
MIAEAGVNHCGSFSLAKKMIRVAAQSGADYIKFQTFDPAELVTASATKARYQQKTTGARESQKKMLQKLCLTQNQFRLLKKECRRQRIGFLSTAFDSGSLRFVESLRPDYHKISSGDIDNVPFLRQVASYGRPVILSTGMASLRELGQAIHILTQAGLSKRSLVVLQCHTDYPTRPADANLRVIDTIQKIFGVRAGLSDHTQGISVSLAAVARGAMMIEKHFTLDRSLLGPDHQASITPRELEWLVKGIREVEVALGDGVKRPSRREIRIKEQVRKFLVAARPIREGERFTIDNLALKRSGSGIPAARWDFYLGKKAKRKYQPDDII